MIITTPEDITPDWLTSVLARNGIESRVHAVQTILSRNLPISTVHRLSIVYQDKSNAPRSFFLKLTQPLPDGMVPNCRCGTEVEFYRTVAHRMSSPPLIKCYDAQFSEETGRTHILLDDLFETHTQPEQRHSPSLEMSRLAVEALAKTHGACWNSPELGNAIGEILAGDALRRFIEDLNTSVSQFLAATELSPDQLRAYDRMLASAYEIWGRLSRTDHLTVTHGDMHWWNFLLPSDPSVHSVHMLDWQLWHVDLGARDLAFLLALGGFAEPRPEIEEELLHVYHDTLEIDDYSWEMLMEDYRWSAIRNLNIPVIFWSQHKHESTWRDAVRRAFDSYERLGCAELIS